tara:strand:- start:7347 stop:7529 length:183 start_codon:yes stop_codon:yes gene_type:complete
MENILMILWLYTGMYGYMYWIKKRNTKHSRKWRSDEVNIVPMIGIFGPLSFVIGYILFKK